MTVLKARYLSDSDSRLQLRHYYFPTRRVLKNYSRKTQFAFAPWVMQEIEGKCGLSSPPVENQPSPTHFRWPCLLACERHGFGARAPIEQRADSAENSL